MSLVLTDDWWATSEGLVEMAEEAAGVDLAPKARRALVEMSVELIVLLTCWPGAARPADALAYLRTRRARMIAYAPWLYALPPSVRRLLVGTDCLPSVLTFVVGGQCVDEALRRAWRKELEDLKSHLAAVECSVPELGPPPTDAGAAEAASCSTPTTCPKVRRDRHHGPCRVGPRRSGSGGGSGRGTGVAQVGWGGRFAARPRGRRRGTDTERGRSPPHNSAPATCHR